MKKRGKNFEDNEEENLWENGSYWKLVHLPVT